MADDPALVGADALVDEVALAADDAPGEPAADVKTRSVHRRRARPPVQSTTTATTAARPTAAPGAYSHRRRGRRPPAAAGRGGEAARDAVVELGGERGAGHGPLAGQDQRQLRELRVLGLDRLAGQGRVDHGE